MRSTLYISLSIFIKYLYISTIIFIFILSFTSKACAKKPPTLFRFYDNGRWGYANDQGHVVIPARFEWALEFSEGFACVWDSVDWTYIDTDGKTLIKLMNRSVNQTPNTKNREWQVPCSDFKGGLAGIASPSLLKSGFINSTGRVVSPPQYDDVQEFSEGLAAVATYEMGFIDNPYAGDIFSGLSPPTPAKSKPSRAKDFHGISTKERTNKLDRAKAAAIKNPSKKIRARLQVWGFIDATGRILIKPKFREAGNFAEGLAAVKTDKGYGFIDRTGKFIIKPQFESAMSFKDGLAPISLHDKWGYINKKGKIVIHCQFDQVRPFTEGFAAVRVDEKWGFIRKNGEFLVAPAFDTVKDFFEGLAVIESETLWGYIDQDGKIAIKPSFCSAESFSEGVAFVTTPENRGTYIGATGEISLAGDFVYGSPFVNGFAKVIMKGYKCIEECYKVHKKDCTNENAQEGYEEDCEVTCQDDCKKGCRRKVAYIDKAGRTILSFVDPSECTPTPVALPGITIRNELLLPFQDFVLPPASGLYKGLLATVQRGISYAGVDLYLEVLYLESVPPGAKVYLVPLLDWERDEKKILNDINLRFFQVPDGDTNVRVKVYEQVYMAIFARGEQRIMRKIDVLRQKSNRVNVKFED